MNGLYLDVILYDVLRTSFDITFHYLFEMSYTAFVRVAQTNSKCCKLKFTPHPLPPHGTTAPSGPGPPHWRGLTITLRHTIHGRIPLDE